MRYLILSMILLGAFLSLRWWNSTTNRSDPFSANDRRAITENNRAVAAWRSGDRSRVEALLLRANWRGVNALAALDDEASELRLIELLLEGDVDLAFMAASPLAMRKTDRAMSALLSAVKSDRTAVPVRNQAAMAIVESGTGSAFQQLQALLLHSIGDVAYACAWAIHRGKRVTPKDAKVAAWQVLRSTWERQLREKHEDAVEIGRRLQELYREEGDTPKGEGAKPVSPTLR